MKSLEKGQDKIQKICDKLRNKTLEPAQQEAKTIIEAAQKKGEELLQETKKQAEQLIKQARGQIEQERNVFQAALKQASKQTVEGLRQEIEHHLFNKEIDQILEKPLSEAKLVADLINGIVKALEKEGLNADLTVAIPRAVSAREVTVLLLENVCKKLKGKPLEIGNFSGGAQVKLQGHQMTLDLTDQAIKELLANYIRKDFRQLIFSQ